MAVIQVNLHYLAPPVKNWRILCVESFTARMPLLTAHLAVPATTQHMYCYGLQSM